MTRGTTGRGARAASPTSTTTGVRRWRGALATVAATTLVAALTACTDQATGPESAPEDAPVAVEVPTLEPEWSIPGLNAMPEAVGSHHWATHQEVTSGVGRNMRSSPGPLLMVDTRTGRTRRPNPEPERFPCLWPTPISADGVVPVLWQIPGGGDPINGAYPSPEPCARITVHDADSGRLLWRRDALDLTGLGARRALGADDAVVVVADARGRRNCFGARTGEAVPDGDEACRALAERLSHRDLPRLRAPDGSRFRITIPAWPQDVLPTEIARTDEVLLVRHQVYDDAAMDSRWAVLAHDLATGETLWEDQLEVNPHRGGPWWREETYFAAPSGLVRVSYEHPEDPDAVNETPMVLTAVDARTGEDVRPVARVEGGWFNHQFDGVLVALTEEGRGFDSTISGFRLPTW